MSKNGAEIIPSSQFKPYEKYKDSGVEWLGEIPIAWGLKRLKRVVSFQGGGTPEKDNLEYWLGDIPWVSPKDMKVSVVVDTEDKITPKAIRESATNLVPTGAVLIVVRSGILAHTIPVALAGCEVTLNQDLKAMIPRSELLPQYLVYLLSGKQRELLFEWKKEGATVESLDLDLVVRTPIPVPDLAEQRAIAGFLDREMAKIDALVAKKERLIELLQEKRAALITDAVTKGLNENVPMKDSGVDWLGRIPAHWHLKKLKHVCDRVFVGIAEAATFAYVEDGVPMLRSTDVRANRIRTDDIRRIDRRFADRLCSKKLKTGDIVTVRTGNAGVSAVVPPEYDEGQCFTLVVSRPTRRHDSRYFCYWLNVPPGQQQFAVEGMGTAQINISVPIVQNTIVCVPSPEEQGRIADWIDQQVTRLDALMVTILNAIDRLKEFRTALISVAVTGKIDIRGEAHEP